MILEVDYGNTRLKWRLLDSFLLECVARGAVIDPQELMLSLREVGGLELKFCRVCSVRADTENIKLTTLISAAYGVDVEYAQSTKTLAGVTNGYKNAAQLGVDRWLVVVAAYAKMQTACMVIDCGTAITVDYIRADGVHLGGCIAPGLRLMSSALNCNTQLVSDVSNVIGGEPLLAGRDTQVAVGLGIRSMLTGFVKEQLVAAEAELGARFVALSTGGDSDLVKAVDERVLLDDDLVFAGLAIACPYIDIQ